MNITTPNQVGPVDSSPCWKTIGVWSKSSHRCERLKEVDHCRNCQTYKESGRDLLERDLPETYVKDWTKVLAVKKEEEILGTISIVICKIEKELIAFPTSLFEEVMDTAHIHTIPHRNNPALIGIINIHGEAQLCVSLGELLGMKDTRISDIKAIKSHKKLMMVMSHEERKWVFPVDSIIGVFRIHPHEYSNVPSTVKKSKTTFTKEVFEFNGDPIAFLDHELLFYNLSRRVK